MAILGGTQDTYPEDDPSTQVTAKLPKRTEDNQITGPEVGEHGYQMSPILEQAIALAKARNFIIPVCPLCLMAYEEEAGKFITLDNSIPEDCWHHQKWLREGTPQERFLKMHVKFTALKWYLWPPGYPWPDLG